MLQLCFDYVSSMLYLCFDSEGEVKEKGRRVETGGAFREGEQVFEMVGRDGRVWM